MSFFFATGTGLDELDTQVRDPSTVSGETDRSPSMGNARLTNLGITRSGGVPFRNLKSYDPRAACKY
jgi:hypothetical protein